LKISATGSGVPYDVTSAMSVGYVELAVQPALADRVVCTWIDRRAGPRAVLPDACIDLVWNGEQVTVAGPDTRAADVEPNKTYVGIRFRPGAAPGVLGLPASELLDRDVALAELWGAQAAGDLAEQLAGAGVAGAPQVLENALLRYLSDAPPPDPLVDSLVHEVHSGRYADAAVVQHLAERTGLSPRSLHRRCTAALGYGPKTLDRILRFRRALRLIGRHVGLADAALQAGYADQAHLSNECRRLGGATPRDFSASSPIVLSANGL
jgi:AraC-like DNA-binding protein